MTNSHQNARRVALNVISNFSAYMGWAIMLGSFAVTAHWVRLAPRTPDFARGAVFKHNEHGSITYFTAYQYWAEWLPLFGGGLLFILAAAAVPKRDVVYRTGFLYASVRFKPDDPEGVRYWAGAAGLVAGLMLVSILDQALFEWYFDQIRAITGRLH